eukprot:355965-Chlamydomonas_euryale.AAC.3
MADLGDGQKVARAACELNDRAKVEQLHHLRRSTMGKVGEGHRTRLCACVCVGGGGHAWTQLHSAAFAECGGLSVACLMYTWQTQSCKLFPRGKRREEPAG